MPKRLVGGVFLLCLTALTLTMSEDSETYTNITEPEILEQLTNLKNYIPNPSMIKPVWVQLKNGDEIVVVQGELKVVDKGEFEIIVIINGYKLQIHIEFTQVLNSDDEPLDDWYIDTNDAKYLFTSNYQRFVVEDVKNIDGNILSTLQCGDVVIKHDESGEHSYVVTFKSETGICLTYTDAYCVETQSYDYEDNAWVYNSEDKTIIAEPRLENIVDADGHKRFVEGNGNPVNMAGVTITYNKWSLSGTHLMFVIAGNVASGTSLAFGCDFTLPKWIHDKIYPVFGGSILSLFKITLTDNSWNTQEVNAYFGKASDNKVSITQSSGATEITSDKAFRIQYDLLIDNE